ncbi:putative START-like domain-containing protein [Lupinus albus]|uniref:Putative START-like domain-containing protein n=1 Tax=Lupinus albus TaxID=3870 RepID=A0A6A4NNG9_LUPAL|nr:putative START-like domain-containing protein [Lupinus albus]
MEKRRKIVQYRERLDKTLASPDLTNDQIIKTIVKSQFLPSSEQEIEGYKEKLIETKTAEVFNILDMLRSASVDDKGAEGCSTSHTDWKIKEDNDEFRVMYREAPEGTPFHTLLVEGYVDGPVDVCLCLSWESSLYKKWWPQSTIPPFKITVSDRLQKVQIGEQISLVRMKVSWPLSMREVIVHYYVFEYFQEDLIVVILNSISEPKRVNETIFGFDKDTIPEAKDVVRLDLVGGLVIQKVTSERSYFRTIANMDIKLDFVPPSLINFISRHLIGSGFRLFQKAVASKMSNDKEFIQALWDPLYVRIREALYNANGSTAMGGKELNPVDNFLPSEDLIQSKQDEAKHASCEDRNNQYATNFDSEIVENVGEIAEDDSDGIVQIEEEDKKLDRIPNEEVGIRSAVKDKKNVYISSEVKLALETLDRAISMVRKNGFHSRRSPSSSADEESHRMEKGGTVDSYSSKLTQQCPENDFSFHVSNSTMIEETSQELGNNSVIQNFRHTRKNPNLKEVDYNKVLQASPEKNLSRPIEENQFASNSLKNGTTMDQTRCNNKPLNIDTVQDMSSDDPKNSTCQKKSNTLVTQGIYSDVPKQPKRQRKYRYCCFLHNLKLSK